MTRSIELHGHRGARALFPENTLAGFAETLAIGVDALEMDVALTADDVVVVTHDARLNPDLTRGRDGRWLEVPTSSIRSLPRAVLRDYDVGRLRPGTPYAALYPEQAPRDGATIPSLAEVMRLDASVICNIELKSMPLQPGLTAEGVAMAAAVVAVADTEGASGRIIVQSFDWRGLRHLRRTRPEIRLSWLTSTPTALAARDWWGGPHPSDYAGSVARAVAAEGAQTWGPEHINLTEATVAEAISLGLRVVPWTVNRADDMHRLIRWGVAGLITDRPDVARRVMGELGLRLPCSRRGQEVRRG